MKLAPVKNWAARLSNFAIMLGMYHSMSPQIWVCALVTKIGVSAPRVPTIGSARNWCPPARLFFEKRPKSWYAVSGVEVGGEGGGEYRHVDGHGGEESDHYVQTGQDGVGESHICLELIFPFNEGAAAFGHAVCVLVCILALVSFLGTYITAHRNSAANVGGTTTAFTRNKILSF